MQTPSPRIVWPSALLLALASLPCASQGVGDPNPVPAGAGSSPGSHRPGSELPKPGGGTFFLDEHRNGRARELFLEELSYGRLVHVHGLDGLGRIDPLPVFRDFLVGESVQTDDVDYRLLGSAATGIQRLIVLRRPGAPEPSPGAGTFADLVRRAELAAVTIPVRDVHAPFVAEVPRNATLSLRFSDLLDDGPLPAQNLPVNVHLRTGVPPSVPFEARILFDAHHGGLAGGAFHATRVLIDATISTFEALESPAPLNLNALGFPPSASSAANLLVQLPTRFSPGTGQFTRLENLAGRPLTTSGNGPIDPATGAIVRAARGGSALAPNGGFLLDVEPPTVFGAAGVSVTAAVPDPNGAPGFAFLVDWTFQTSCADSPRIGDALEIGGRTFELSASGPGVGPGGTIQGARVHLAQRTAVVAGDLLGAGVLLAGLRAGTAASPCWIEILPAPSRPPGGGVATTARFNLRFSEAVHPESLDPYDNLRLVQGPLGVPADALNSVVAEILTSGDLTQAALEPLLPLAHVQGTATPYHLELLAGAVGPTDLAGNPLTAGLAAELRIARGEASQTSAGIVLRLSSPDEVPGPGTDLRGPFTLANGRLHPRPPVHTSAVVDRTNPVPSIMTPAVSGVQTPLSPLGSKLQSVWRYCDLGWSVRDETKYDVDVVGLNWAPVGGLVITDFFEGFEIRLAHSVRLPDEDLDRFLLPKYANSGLFGRTHPYTDNILVVAQSPQTIVHPRTLGYAISPADLFMSNTGTALMPYPLNRGPGPLRTYTWRDTSVLAVGGAQGAGVPLDVEVGAPLFLEPEVGALAPAGSVPSIGLPLLLEYRCYPTARGLGLNALDVSLAINSSPRPSFRAYSTGGINRFGLPVVKDPDLELSPSGGFNPSSTPPGLPSAEIDNVFYLGQLDLVHRVTRVHSAWLDSGALGPDYVGVRLGARASSLPGVELAWRGADGFSGTGGSEEDAAQLDAYGEVPQGSVAYLNGDATWRTQLDAIDGARHVQVRLTLLNDLEAGTSPVLDVLALAFER